MSQTDQPKFSPSAIAALKAATRQVVHPVRGGASNGVQSAASDEDFSLPIVMSPVAITPHDAPKQKLQPMQPHESFAESFVRKIASVEQEKGVVEKEQLIVDQELVRAQQLQADLIAKKEQLDNRRNELLAVKDKLITLDKELSEVLKPTPL